MSCTLLFVCLGISSVSFGQDAGNWTLAAPPNSVELVSLDQPTGSGTLRFTFRNVSGKTIIQFRVDDLHGNMNGLDAFSNGMGAISPGATFFITFDTRQLTEQNQTSGKLHVAAVFYADGTAVGEGRALASVENEMLGVALETKRNSDLLAGSSDSSLAGLDGIAEHVNNQSVRSDKEAAESLRGITLPGISQAYIHQHLSPPRFALRVGMNRA
jgi:hypothetical protein